MYQVHDGQMHLMKVCWQNDNTLKSIWNGFFHDQVLCLKTLQKKLFTIVGETSDYVTLFISKVRKDILKGVATFMLSILNQ